MTIIIIFLLMNVEFVAQIFTQDVFVIQHIIEVFDFIAAYLILSAISGVNMGIVRALAKQPMVSIAAICSYYLIGVPLALVLGFKYNQGVSGFWLGFTIALFVLDIIVALIIMRTDWKNVGKNIPQLEDDEDDKYNTGSVD